jgi:hypothetical protein
MALLRLPLPLLVAEGLTVRVKESWTQIVKRKENKTCHLEIGLDQRDRAPERAVALAFVVDSVGLVL